MVYRPPREERIAISCEVPDLKFIKVGLEALLPVRVTDLYNNPTLHTSLLVASHLN